MKRESYIKDSLFLYMINFSSSLEHFQGNIYDYISQEEIYFRCLGFYPNEKDFFKSPFAAVDRTPSLRFKQDQNLFFKCFSTGKSGDAIAFVAELHSLTYKQAILYIFNNFPLQKIPTTTAVIPKRIVETKIELSVHPKIPVSFYNYWNQFYVSTKGLVKYNIKPAEQVWLTNDKYTDLLIATYKDRSPVIRYLVNGRYKIYLPYEKKEKKWISNTKQDDIQGFKELPERGDLLIISKAMKDVLVWNELGYNAIAFCSESANLRPEVYNHLKGRFTKIISFLDNDKAGIEAMTKYRDQYQIPFTMIPSKFELKDIAEFIHAYNPEGTLKLIKTLKYN